MARPDFTETFKIQADASDVAIGGVLTQMHDDGEHPVVYTSKLSTPAEKNYSVTERELLATLFAINRN